MIDLTNTQQHTNQQTGAEEVTRPYKQAATPERRAQIIVRIARATLERNCGTVEPHLVEALKRAVASEISDELKQECQALIEEAQQ